MGFVPVKSMDGASDPFEYGLMTNAEAVTINEALKFTSGRLTKASGTDIPEAIALATKAAGTDVKIPFVRLDEQREFEVKSTATVASTLVGNKVTLHTDGLNVTATTTSGVFLISATDGATTNSTVRGYFRR
ncbi:hypothetical protein [Paenibacillus harenae]|uniref:hypothetical protein n=1 Tax=Paenibacillus harenae TaxID=306543 RepID=UPI002793E365|nr:hypothetical protein [Paenibacillus harenae]MDQ0062380.1 hypothetical protein [Paenibacillus harenae]